MKNRIEFDPTVLELRCNRERHTQTEIDVKHITPLFFRRGLKRTQRPQMTQIMYFYFH